MAKTLDLLKAVLQSSFNMEVKRSDCMYLTPSPVVDYDLWQSPMTLSPSAGCVMII